jgi:hypothetical protein
MTATNALIRVGLSSTRTGETMQQLATEYEVGVGRIHRALKPTS